MNTKIKPMFIFLVLVVQLALITSVQTSAGFDNTFIEFQFNNWDSDRGYVSITLVDVPNGGGGQEIHYVTIKVAPGTRSLRVTEDALYSRYGTIVPWLDEMDYLIITTKDSQDEISDVSFSIILFDSGQRNFVGLYNLGNSASGDSMYFVFEVNFYGNQRPSYAFVSNWMYGQYPNVNPWIMPGRSSSWISFHSSFKQFVVSSSSYPYVYIENTLNSHSFEDPILH